MAKTAAATLQQILIELKVINSRMADAQLAKTSAEIDEVGAASARASAEGNRMGKSFSRATFNAGLLGKSLGLLKRATKDLAIVGAAAVGGAIFSGISFEQEMAKVRSITRGASDPTMFAKMNQAALEAATNTRFSAKQAAEAMYLLGRAGFTAKEELRALPGTLNLAHAAAIPLGLAAEVMGETLRGFSLEAKDATLVTDTLARATKGGALTINDMRYSIKYIGSMAVATRQPLANMVGLLEVLARHGIKGSQAGTTLRSMLTRLTRPVKMVKDGLALLNMEAKDLYGPKGMKPLNEIFNTMRLKGMQLDPVTRNKAFSMISGQWASSGLFATINTPADQVKAFIDALDPKRVRGSAHKIASILNDTIQMQLLRTVHTLQAIGIGFFQAFGTNIKGHVRGLADSLKGVVDNMPGIQRFIKEGNWQGMADQIDFAVGANGRLSKIIMIVIDAMQVTWKFIRTVLWPVFKDLAIVVGATLYLSFKAIIGIMRIMNGHNRAARWIIWFLIGAYVALKIAMWANTTALKIQLMWKKRQKYWAGLELIWTGLVTAATWAWGYAMQYVNLMIALNPIAILITLFVLLVVALVILYFKWKRFHNAVDSFFNFLWDHWELISMVPIVGQMAWAIGMIIKHWDSLAKFFRHPIAGVEHIWDWMLRGFSKAINWIIHQFNKLNFTLHVPEIDLGPLGSIGGGSYTIGVGHINDVSWGTGPVKPNTSVGNFFPPKVLNPIAPDDPSKNPLINPVVSVQIDGKEVAKAVNKHNTHTRARK